METNKSIQEDAASEGMMPKGQIIELPAQKRGSNHWIDYKTSVPKVNPESLSAGEMIGCDWFSTKNTSVKVGDKILLINLLNGYAGPVKAKGIFPSKVDDEILVAYDRLDGLSGQPLTVDLMLRFRSCPLSERVIGVILRRGITRKTWKEMFEEFRYKGQWYLRWRFK